MGGLGACPKEEIHEVSIKRGWRRDWACLVALVKGRIREERGRVEPPTEVEDLGFSKTTLET